MIEDIIRWIVTGIIWLFKAFIIYMLLVVASSVFWKGETGREMRSCCFAYIIMAAVGCVITIPIAMCERRQDQKKQEPASLYRRHRTGRRGHHIHSLNPSPEYTDFQLRLSEVSRLFNVIQLQPKVQVFR